MKPTVKHISFVTENISKIKDFCKDNYLHATYFRNQVCITVFSHRYGEESLVMGFLKENGIQEYTVD